MLGRTPTTRGGASPLVDAVMPPPVTVGIVASRADALAAVAAVGGVAVGHGGGRYGSATGATSCHREGSDK